MFSPARSNPDPIANALVYVPNLAPGAKLPALEDGPSCGACTPSTAEAPIAQATTGPDGSFKLENVPAGTNIPLVVQLGHWRRQIAVHVEACVDNVIPSGQVRLPRNQAEGDIPLTAISTGNVDAIECLLRKLGLDDAEFTNPSGPGRIHLYQANGARIDATTPPETELSGTAAGGGAWSRYDQVILPCVGSETSKSSAALGNLRSYLDRGGRVFATHFSYAWLFQNGPLATTATWQTQQAIPSDPLTATVDTSFAKGLAFAQWLQMVGATSNVSPPQIQIRQPRHDLDGVSAASGAERWLYSDPSVRPTPSTTPRTVQHYTVDTPISAAAADRCGRLTFSDFHVLDAVTKDIAFPTACDENPLTAQEKVLEFMFFDLASCTAPAEPPIPPPPRPPPPAPPPVSCKTALVAHLDNDGGVNIDCRCEIGAFRFRPCSAAECFDVCVNRSGTEITDALRSCACQAGGPCLAQCRDTFCGPPGIAMGNDCLTCLKSEMLNPSTACSAGLNEACAMNPEACIFGRGCLPNCPQ